MTKHSHHQHESDFYHLDSVWGSKAKCLLFQISSAYAEGSIKMEENEDLML